MKIFFKNVPQEEIKKHFSLSAPKKHNGYNKTHNLYKFTLKIGDGATNFKLK